MYLTIGNGLIDLARTVSFFAWILISPICVRNTKPSIPIKSPKSSRRLNTELYSSLSSPGQISSRVMYTWMRPLESCNSTKDALPITRRLMIRPATETWRGSSSSLNSALISVEKALVTYSAAGYGSIPIARSSFRLLRRMISCSLSSNIFISLRINSILEAKIRNFSHISCNPPLFCIFAASN